MIITLNLRPDVTVLAVPVEMNAHGFAIIGNVTLAYDYNGYTKKSLLLPPGSYELIGLLKEVSELAAASWVKWRTGMEGEVMYWDYRTNEKESGGFKALDSLRSAITAAGGDPKRNWLIITKK